MLFSQLGLAVENSVEPDGILGMGIYLLTRESGLRPQIFFKTSTPIYPVVTGPMLLF